MTVDDLEMISPNMLKAINRDCEKGRFVSREVNIRVTRQRLRSYIYDNLVEQKLVGLFGGVECEG